MKKLRAQKVFKVITKSKKEEVCQVGLRTTTVMLPTKVNGKDVNSMATITAMIVHAIQDEMNVAVTQELIHKLSAGITACYGIGKRRAKDKVNMDGTVKAYKSRIKALEDMASSNLNGHDKQPKKERKKKDDKDKGGKS